MAVPVLDWPFWHWSAILSDTAIGLVIPAYNAVTYLALTVGSIQAQSFGNWSCVIVDDGSTDATLAVAHALADEDPRITVIAQSNSGVAAARNAGAQSVFKVVEFLMFIDADDVLLPEALRLLVQGIVPETVASCGLATYIDRLGVDIDSGRLADFQRHYWDWAGHERELPGKLELGHLCAESRLGPPAVFLVRVAPFRDAGGFDHRLSYAADWDLWQRLAREGPIAFVPEVLVGYRKHETNMTLLDNISGYRELRWVRSATRRDPRNKPEQVALLRAASRHHHRRQAAKRRTLAATPGRTRERVGHLLAAVGHWALGRTGGFAKIPDRAMRERVRVIRGSTTGAVPLGLVWSAGSGTTRE